MPPGKLSTRTLKRGFPSVNCLFTDTEIVLYNLTTLAVPRVCNRRITCTSFLNQCAYHDWKWRRRAEAKQVRPRTLETLKMRQLALCRPITGPGPKVADASHQYVGWR